MRWTKASLKPNVYGSANPGKLLHKLHFFGRPSELWVAPNEYQFETRTQFMANRFFPIATDMERKKACMNPKMKSVACSIYLIEFERKRGTKHMTAGKTDKLALSLSSQSKYEGNDLCGMEAGEMI